MGAIGQGANDELEEEGYVPEANYWGYWKKICPTGVCHGGHFEWDVSGWYNQPNCSGSSDVFNVAKTFGCDSGSDANWGRAGFLYSQGDGVMSFPGKDVLHTPSFGFLGGIATLNLKKMRDGLTDVDYLNAAYAVNPSSTTALVQEVYSKALWEVTCQSATDCSYSWGDRSWSYGADTWVRARERALMIAAGASASPKSISGRFTPKGGGTWR
jgi:hypothetical protein